MYSKKTRKKNYNGGVLWLSNKQTKKLRPFFPLPAASPGRTVSVEQDNICAASWLPLAGCPPNLRSIQNPPTAAGCDGARTTGSRKPCKNWQAGASDST